MKVATQDVPYTRRDCELALSVLTTASSGDGTPQVVTDLGLSAAPQWGEVLPGLDAKLEAARFLVAKLERAVHLARSAAQFDQFAIEDDDVARARAAAAAACGEHFREFHDSTRTILAPVPVRQSWTPAIAAAAAKLELARAQEPPVEDLRARVAAVAGVAGIDDALGVTLAFDTARSAMRRQGRVALGNLDSFVVGAYRLGDEDVAVRVAVADPLNDPHERRLTLDSVAEWRNLDPAAWARGGDAIVIPVEDIPAR